MLSENIKVLRKAKGLSQEELALRLNVVRQTVSKWEKGLSVPDAEMLQQLAETLEVSVSVLLGEVTVQDDNTQLQILAAKLEILNEQFARQAARRRKTWRIVFIVVGCVALLTFLISAFGIVSWFTHQVVQQGLEEGVAIIGGADGPTQIFVARTPLLSGAWIPALFVCAGAIVGICLTRKK